MRFPWPNLARWQGRQWAIALSLLLAITLTPLGWIQWRQFRLLDDVSNNQVDSIMWQAYQLERELGRLRQSLTHAGSPEVDGDALVERYEVFLSRIDLLTNIPRRDLLEASFEYTTTVALINPRLGKFNVTAKGGLVEAGSLVRGQGETVTFSVTDTKETIPVSFTGVLPDLFSEGQGMIGTGQMVAGTFVATEILAKHDETYMPKEVMEALKEQGVYQDPNG